MAWFDELNENDKSWLDQINRLFDVVQSIPLSDSIQTQFDLIVSDMDEMYEEFDRAAHPLNRLALLVGMPGYADITEVDCFALFTYPDSKGDMRLRPVRCKLCGECNRWVKENEDVWVCEHTTEPEYEYAASLTRVLDHFPDDQVILAQPSDIDAHIDWV